MIVSSVPNASRLMSVLDPVRKVMKVKGYIYYRSDNLSYLTVASATEFIIKTLTGLMAAGRVERQPDGKCADN